MSKFTFDTFYNDDFKFFAVSKKLFSKEQADELLRREHEIEPSQTSMDTEYVYYGFGIDLYGDRVNGYWLNEEPHGRNPIECFVYMIKY